MELSEVLNSLSAIVWGPVMSGLLVGTGIYLTIRLRFVQILHLKHAVKCISGVYDNPHFVRLSLLLSGLEILQESALRLLSEVPEQFSGCGLPQYLEWQPSSHPARWHCITGRSAVTALRLEGRCTTSKRDLRHDG